MSHNQGNSENSGFTAPFNAPGQDVSRASKARLESILAARQAPPDVEWEAASREPVAWEAMYRDLLEERTEEDKARWDWRKALYIAWSCVPTHDRWPKYEYELAEQFLGLSNTRTIRQWKEKDPEIEQRIAEGPKKALLSHIADVMAALAGVAASPDPRCHQDRKLFLEITGQYKPSGKVELTGEDGGPIDVREVSELSDEELERIAAGGSQRTVGTQALT